MKKSLILVLSLVLVLLPTVSAGASVIADNGKELPNLVNYIDQFNWPEGPNLYSEGAYLIEANTGTVLYRQNANEQYYPASITKVLTALVVVENVSDLSEMLTFSYNAVNGLEEGGYSYVAKEGDQLSVEDTLYAMLLNSSNEAAIALAEHVSGSVEEFAKLMNKKAEELGCTGSSFCNPNGLTNLDHKTTPHDMALILRAAVNNDKFLEIDKHTSHTTAPTTSQVNGYPCNMTHKMMQEGSDYYDDRVVCGKTGYLSIAQNTLVTYASYNGMDLICCVMRANGATAAYQDTRALFNYGFNNFYIKNVDAAIDKNLLKAEIEARTAKEVEDFTYNDSFSITLPNDVKNVDIAWSLNLASDADQGSIDYYMIQQPLQNRPITISYKTSVVTDIESAVTLEDGSVNWVIIVASLTALAAIIAVVVLVVLRKKKR